MATRVLLAGLSVASFFTVGGTMLAASSTQSAVVQPASATASLAGSSATPATPATATSKSATSAPVAHTVTRGS